MNRFRPAMGRLHNWSGLLLGWLLFVIFVTGACGYYRHEVTLMMQPELHPLVGANISQANAAEQAAEWLSAHAPQAEGWTIDLPDEESPAVRVSWFGATSGAETLDPRNGQALRPAPRETGGGDFLYRLHSDLHFMPPIAGRILVSLIGVALLVLLVTGLVVHRNILRNLFRLRLGKGWRTRLDLHNMSGVIALPYHLLIVGSGLVTVTLLIMPWGMTSVYGSAGLGTFAQEAFVSSPGPASNPAARNAPSLGELMDTAKNRWHSTSVGEISIANPGTADMTTTIAHPIRGILPMRKPAITFDAATGRVLETSNSDISPIALLHSQIFGLHVAHFAGPIMRFLLFLLGIAGAGMVATGMLLWTAKRRLDAPAPRRSVAVIDRINAAVIAGLPVAIASYFWANRVLAPYITQRAVLEQNAMFAVWGLAWIWALVAPARWVWPTLLGVGGIGLTASGTANSIAGFATPLSALLLVIGAMLIILAAKCRGASPALHR